MIDAELDPGLPPAEIAPDEPEREPAGRRDTKGRFVGDPSRPIKDPKPRKRKRRSDAGKPKPHGESKRKQTELIEAALAQILTAPAIPAMMLAPDPIARQFLSTHFLEVGPKTAHQLAELSEQYPALRALLENLLKGNVRVQLAIIIGGYLAPPVLWIAGIHQVAAVLSNAGRVDPDQLAAAMAQAAEQQRAAAEAAQAQYAATNGDDPESTEQQGDPTPQAAPGEAPAD